MALVREYPVNSAIAQRSAAKAVDVSAVPAFSTGEQRAADTGAKRNLKLSRRSRVAASAENQQQNLSYGLKCSPLPWRRIRWSDASRESPSRIRTSASDARPRAYMDVQVHRHLRCPHKPSCCHQYGRQIGPSVDARLCALRSKLKIYNNKNKNLNIGLFV